MKRRLRKKLHRAEFVEHGFDLSAQFAAHTTPDDHEAALWELIAVVESRGLCLGGSFGRTGRLEVFVTGANPRRCGRPRTARRDVTTDDMCALVAWLTARGDVTNATGGPLVDAWK